MMPKLHLMCLLRALRVAVLLVAYNAVLLL